MRAPAPTVVREWNHTIPPLELQHYDLQLLTITGISVLGRWCGHVGEFYIGWGWLLNCTHAQLIPSAPAHLSNDWDADFQFNEQALVS